MKTYVVLGGGAAGMTFASQFRKLNSEDRLVVIEKSPYVAWAGCPTPYYIGDKLSEKALIHGKIEDFEARKIEILVNHEVLEINIKDKTLFVKNLKENKDFTINYDFLIYAAGAKPKLFNYEEYLKYEGVFVLNHVVDAFKIKEYLSKNNIKKATIIGAGLIGLEIAENLKERGIEVAIFEKADTVLPFLPQSISKQVLDIFNSHNVPIYLNTTIEKINIENNKIKSVITSNGEEFNSDLLILSLGVTPNTDLLKKERNIKFAKNGALVVDHKFKVYDSIYAIGDSIITRHILTNQEVYAPLGDVADKQGLLLAYMLNGKDISYRGVMGSVGTSFFGNQIATTGLTFEVAKEFYDEISTISVNGFPRIKAFKNTEPIKFEVVYNKANDTLLGASAIGKECVAQFIDQFAILIDKEIPVKEFIHFDFVYSPTISTVWNPILATYRKIYRS